MNHRKMPPLSEMERIEQSLLGEKLDEMLDRMLLSMETQAASFEYEYP